jgi:hypothetical protein
MEKRHGQPCLVTLVIYGVFLLGAGYFLQAGQALSHYSLNSQLPLSVPAWYQPLSGALWGVLWVVLGTGMLRRREWARRFSLVVIPLQIGFWLADWWLFSRSKIAIQSFGFDLLLRLLLAGLSVGILLLSGRWDAPGEKDESASALESKRENIQAHVE